MIVKIQKHSATECTSLKNQGRIIKDLKIES